MGVTIWVKYQVKQKDSEYHMGLLVCTDFLREMPVSNKIVLIFLRNDICVLVLDIGSSFGEHFDSVVDSVSLVTTLDLEY